MARTEYKGRKEKGGAGPGAVRLSHFLNEDASQPVRPIYILHGTDPYLLEQARRALRQRALGDADPGLALVECQGPDAVLADVLDSLRTLPFLAPRRLVSIREADEFLADEHRREVLLKYLEAPVPTGTLCLEVKTWNPLMLIAKRAVEIGLVIQCESDKPEKIPVWLQGDAKKRYDKKLTFGAAQMLAEYIGQDFASLVSAVDRLAAYAGDAAEIDETAVDALITRGHHEQVWDLARAASQRNTARALELLDAFWADGMEAPNLVGLLRMEFRHLLSVKTLMRRMSVDAAMGQAAVPWPAQAGVRDAVRAYSDEHLADAYQSLVDADFDAKSGTDPRMAMETLIHRLCDPLAARAARATAGGFMG